MATDWRHLEHPLFHVNQQCDCHGECDWIIREASKETAIGTIERITNYCPGGELSAREITPAEVKESLPSLDCDDLVSGMAIYMPS